MSQGCDGGVPERGDAVSYRGSVVPGRFMHRLLRFRGMLVGLTRLFVPSQVLLFSVLLGNAVGVAGDIVQFRGLRVIFVM